MTRGDSKLKSSIESILSQSKYVDQYQNLGWSGTFWDYLKFVEEDPNIARNAFQRLYDMVMSYGTRDFVDAKKNIIHYNFFDDPDDQGRDSIFGLDVPIMKFMAALKAAAKGYGTEHRVLLLHGPVGSSKSTIVRALKKGLEKYSRKPEGKLYSFSWILPDPVTFEGKPLLGEGIDELPSPMNEEPLKLLPPEVREEVLQSINHGRSPEDQIVIEGELNPCCRFIYNVLLDYYKGDYRKVLDCVKIRRIELSEKKRQGIATFQPKDEKNQDSTELTGDINYRKIAIFGSESDPRAFNFDGEFQVANRGLIEFIEVLKLDVAFLYDLLGASQEHKIKPKKFPLTDIDEVIIGHTNEPEYRKLQNNEFMEALRDRTVKVDIPYVTKWTEETKIYKRDYNVKRVHGKHVAPHTLEMAAMWAVLTRLDEPKKANLTLLQKLKLYDGKSLAGFTEDNIKELRKESPREGMEGISPRYVQDKISNALVSNESTSINPFMILHELEGGLKHHSLIANEETRKKYRDLLTVVRQEYEDIVKNEVQRAVCADEDSIQKLCANYIDSVKSYTQREKVKNKFTGQYEEPDEKLMRSIEDKIEIPESRKDDFRREIMNYIGALAVEGKTFYYKTNERLHKALELKLFEDQKDSIKLTNLVSNVVDKETQEKIDVVKTRLIKNFGYNDESATDVLNFVASIFARGDIKSKG